MHLRLWRWMAGAIILPAALVILIQVLSDIGSIAVCPPGADHCAPYAIARFWLRLGAGAGIALLGAALVVAVVFRAPGGRHELPVDRAGFAWALGLAAAAVGSMFVAIATAGALEGVGALFGAAAIALLVLSYALAGAAVRPQGLPRRGAAVAVSTYLLTGLPVFTVLTGLLWADTLEELLREPAPALLGILLWPLQVMAYFAGWLGA